MTKENEMVGWHHQLDGHEFEQAPGAGEGQEAWSAAVHGVTKSRTGQNNLTELMQYSHSCYFLNIVMLLH